MKNKFYMFPRFSPCVLSAFVFGSTLSPVQAQETVTPVAAEQTSSPSVNPDSTPEENPAPTLSEAEAVSELKEITQELNRQRQAEAEAARDLQENLEKLRREENKRNLAEQARLKAEIKVLEERARSAENSNRQLETLVDQLEEKSKADEEKLKEVIQTVFEDSKSKNTEEQGDPLYRAHSNLGVGFARNSFDATDTPDRVSFVANSINVLSGTMLGKQDMFTAHGTGQSAVTFGGDGVNLRASVQGGLNVIPQQLTRFVVVGLEPLNMEADLGTLDGRKNFFSWNPMLSGGLKFDFNVSGQPCSASFLGKGGFSIGTLGQGTRTKGAAGGQVLFVCGPATFAGEWISLDTTKPLANDNFLRSALFVDVYKGFGLGFQAEGQFLKQETFGSNPALQDQSSRRFFGVISFAKDFGSLLK